MEINREQICSSLISWLQTFEIHTAYSKPEDLSDGVVIATALQHIAPEFFTMSWMNKIKPTNDITNWRLKVRNLKKIVKGILEYHIEVHGINIQSFQMPDVNAIAEHSDEVELGRLLQLVLGVAVKCDRKQDHIQCIMGMAEGVQQTIKNGIQELMTVEKTMTYDSDNELHDQLKTAVAELHEAFKAKEELMQRCHELDLQVSSLQDEKALLLSDNADLQNRLLQQPEDVIDLGSSTDISPGQFLQRVHLLQDDVFRLESARDDLRVSRDVVLDENSELRKENLDLKHMASECAVIKDELDVLRHISDKAAKYERAIEMYKERLEQTTGLRVQLRRVEDKNTEYIQQKIEMEEEIKHLSLLRQEAEGYMRQVVALRNSVLDEGRRADKWQFEYDQMKEKCAVHLREKEQIAVERDRLCEELEEKMCPQSAFGDVPCIHRYKDDGTSLYGLEMLSLPSEIKERLLRLEHENKMLIARSTDGAPDGDPERLWHLLDDDANARLESEIRLSNFLPGGEMGVDGVHGKHNLSDLNPFSKTLEVERQFDERTSRLGEVERQLEVQSALLLEANRDIESLKGNAERVAVLEESLARKTKELRSTEERYSRYLQKAKVVIESLLEKSLPNTPSPDMESLKCQLLEKDQSMKSLEVNQERQRSLRDQEERLMVTAWYNLGLQLHRQASEDRLVSNSAKQSWQHHQASGKATPAQHNVAPCQHTTASRPWKVSSSNATSSTR